MRHRLFANPWRTAFFALTGLLLVLLVLGVSFWLSVTRTEPGQWSAPASDQQRVPIDATVSLRSINQFVDAQLSQKETPVHHAQVSFDQQRIRTDIGIVFLGRAMDLSMWMKPTVQTNGDLRMVAEDVKVGQWPIPLKTLFGLLEGLPWPPWVHVQPEQHILDFKLSERDGDNQIRLKKIDWAKERIELEVLVGTGK